jgi:DNA-binding CsgD family transcriptional regulator
MDPSLEDVSGIIRLVREVCDRWDDPKTWREHLLHGACQIVNAHSGNILADYDHQPGWFGNIAVIATVGLPPAAKPLLQPYVSQIDHRRIDDVSDDRMRAMSGIVAQIKAQGWVTMAVSEEAHEQSRQLSPIDDEFLDSVDWGPALFSIRVVDVPRRPEVLNAYRPRGSQPFGPREVALIKLLHDEIAPLVGVRLATEEHISRNGLSRRLRETLSLLLEGFSEKQVATQLQLGHRTVHDYVTMLYEHFRVSSRAELLAYFIRRTPAPRADVDRV